MFDNKINIKNLAIFLIAIIMFGSCSEANDSSLVSEINVRVDSLKHVVAPDTRIALWNVAIKNNHNKVSVKAEVGSKKAYIGLLNLKPEFPTVNFSVRLLPYSKIKTHFALINNSVSNIRKKRTRSSELINQALLGTPVKVFKTENEWSLIQTPNQYIGWINNAGIVHTDSVSLSKYKSLKKIVFNRQYGFSYTKPDTKSQTVSDLVIGCILPEIGEVHDFYKVSYPDGRLAFVQKSDVISLDAFFAKKPVGKELVKTALKFNGIPYLWGGLSSKAIDCSGLSSMVYLMNGIVLQRDASQQTKYGKEITTNFDFTKLKPGDLLFFGRKATDSLPEKVTHVAMYIGDGEFIHSSGKVRISSMDSTKSNFIPSYPSRFVRADRIIGMENGNTIQKIADNQLYKILKSK